MKTRRSLLFGLGAAALAGFALLVPGARAGQGSPRSVALEAQLEGRKPMGATVTYVLESGHRTLKARISELHSPSVRLDIGGFSWAVELDPRSGSGHLVLDTRDGDRVPVLSPRDVVTIGTGGRTVLRGILMPSF